MTEKVANKSSRSCEQADHAGSTLIGKCWQKALKGVINLYERIARDCHHSEDRKEF